MDVDEIKALAADMYYKAYLVDDQKEMLEIRSKCPAAFLPILDDYVKWRQNNVGTA